jgi:blue copper oxidase
MRMTINGKMHDVSRIDASVRLGTTEVREMASKRMAHAFHTHGASFRVLSIKDEAPPAHLAGLKDVVLVEDRAKRLVTFHRPALRRHPSCFTVTSQSTRMRD